MLIATLERYELITALFENTSISIEFRIPIGWIGCVVEWVVVVGWVVVMVNGQLGGRVVLFCSLFHPFSVGISRRRCCVTGLSKNESERIGTIGLGGIGWKWPGLCYGDLLRVRSSPKWPNDVLRIKYLLRQNGGSYRDVPSVILKTRHGATFKLLFFNYHISLCPCKD